MFVDNAPAPANPANAPSARLFGDVGIAAGMRVLDVGCGSGDLSRLVAKLAGPDGEVVAIDRSDDALAAGQAAAVPASAAPIRYQQVDLTAEWPDLGHFHAIVGRRVLMYLPDPANTLQKLTALGHPGAILAFQEHGRADLPSGLGVLPVHRQLYTWMWDTVAAEGGDVALAFKLADMMTAQGLTIKQARSEAILFVPGESSFLPTLAQAMLPRLLGRGIAREDEVDLSTLSKRIDDERRTAGGTIVWDLAFFVAARCPLPT